MVGYGLVFVYIERYGWRGGGARPPVVILISTCFWFFHRICITFFAVPRYITQKRSTHAHVHLSVLSPVGGAEPPAVELALAAMEAQTRTCVYIVPFISPQRTRPFLNRDRRARQRWLFMCDAPLACPAHLARPTLRTATCTRRTWTSPRMRSRRRRSTNHSSIRSWPCLDNVWSRFGGQCGWDVRWWAAVGDTFDVRTTRHANR